MKLWIVLTYVILVEVKKKKREREDTQGINHRK